MFDYIRCEVPLPDGWKLEGDALALQTKDFDCELVITRDGRLLCDRREPVGLPAKYMDYGEAFRHRQEHLATGCERVGEIVDTGFDGVMRFGGLEVIGYGPTIDGSHAIFGRRGTPIYKPHHYRAKFVNGRLVEIVVGEN